jgi:two-component system chemotaxis sensor kinase CheA
MDDLLVEFLTETSESLDQLDLELVKLEQDPNDPALLGNIFRLVHTIKGTCGFLGLPRLESVAHAGENILGKFRDGALVVNPDGVTLILECLDQIKELLSELEKSEAEPEGDDKSLIDRLNDYADNGPSSLEAAAGSALEAVAETVETDSADASEADADEHGFVPVPAGQTGMATEEAEPDEHGFVPVPAGEIVTDQSAQVEETADAAPEPAPTPAPTTAPAAQAEAEGGAADREVSVANQSIRVSVGLLEDLMTSISELVLSRNQLLQMVRHAEESEFTAPLQRLNHITTELQENVMKTRMQPIGNAWSKLPRIIRDLAHELDKKIDLQMIGSETELDRQVLEMIKDPLTHMVRNSADHGLEMPADRIAAGKSETGVVRLRAFHEGGQIVIEIHDDGAGISVSKVRQKILQNGLATETQLAAMSDEQIQAFVFNAGFSTAAAVTNVSGRGVGMDVVRTNIEKIGGTVEMKSTEGKGSTFTIKIPLTLAIVSALIVEAGEERFAMPQISVVELVRTSQKSEHRIETIHATPVLRLRDRLLPLINLSQSLNIDGAQSVDENSELFIIVVAVGAQRFGVIVDRVFDTEEIVVKPTAPILRDIPLFSGNTILGDGSVVMILDPNGLANTVSGSQVGDTAETSEMMVSDDQRDHSERLSMLLFEAAGEEPKAVPLGLVSRLEEMDMAKVESASGAAVIQYRGELMPLVTADGGHPLGEDGKRPVLVFADEERKMGLVVDRISDIVEQELNIEYAKTSDGGHLGSAVLADKTHTVLDVGYYLNFAHGDWFGSAGKTTAFEQQKTKILFVDDSPFFRNLVSPLLKVEGFDVTTVDGPPVALRMRDEGRSFDLIISDIEMPEMNGFDFAAACRDDGRWARVPMIALSSHATAADFERGRQVGFNDYVAKFDRDALVSAISRTLQEVGETV